ncbi:MAG: hypothetical protein KDB26_01735 [Microthrixaceae bacterium]|nr:hypothetical protein [Microthrixaceae bacterium]
MADETQLTPEVIERLTTLSDPWLSCDECFEQLDVQVDEVVGEAGSLDEPFRVHLLSCGVCHDEARSLAELIASDYDLSEAQAIERLDHAISHIAPGA